MENDEVVVFLGGKGGWSPTKGGAGGLCLAERSPHDQRLLEQVPSSLLDSQPLSFLLDSPFCISSWIFPQPSHFLPGFVPARFEKEELVLPGLVLR